MIINQKLNFRAKEYAGEIGSELLSGIMSGEKKQSVIDNVFKDFGMDHSKRDVNNKYDMIEGMVKRSLRSTVDAKRKEVRFVNNMDAMPDVFPGLPPFKMKESEPP